MARDGRARRRSASSCSCSTRGGGCGAGVDGPFDFESGLGAWTDDSERFPSGLESLADEAHGARHEVRPVGRARARRAVDGRTSGGSRDEAVAGDARAASMAHASSAQMCLGAPGRPPMGARSARRAHRTTSHPDYLKWDNNFWINCDRDGHGHGSDRRQPGAGAGALRGCSASCAARYPDLLDRKRLRRRHRASISACSPTPTPRWMNDRTAPSAHVRHNLEGLTAAFPPAYLLSFVIDNDGEQMRRSRGPALLVVRSRMPGVLGLTYRAADMGDLPTRLAAADQRYKTYRDTIARASATLLSAQAPFEETGWDIVQEMADAGAHDPDFRVQVRRR